MAVIRENAIVQIASDTAANWTSNDPTLDQGEWGYETDTGFLKMGDGSTAWTSLDYQPNPAEVDGKMTGSTDQLCKAWVNFDGTTNTAGKCTIADSYNVTDVDDNGTGDYTINYTNALNNVNYCVTICVAAHDATTNLNVQGLVKGVSATGATDKTTGHVTIQTGTTNAAALLDVAEIYVMIFGT